MKIPARQFVVPRREAEHILAEHCVALGKRNSSVVSRYRSTVRRFLDELGELPGETNSPLRLNESRLLRWLIQACGDNTVLTFAGHLGVLSRYMKGLHQAGLIDVDLMAEFKRQHDNHSWRCIAQAIRTENPEAALAELRTVPSPRGPLHAFIDPFLELHQSLGKKYIGHAHTLLAFDGFLAAHAIASPQEITDANVQRWLDSLTCSAIVHLQKAHILKQFFIHLQSLYVMTFNPVTTALASLRRPHTAFRPFIFTTVQVAAILAETRRLPRTPRFPLQAETCYTMIALLYALGLRHGEACRIRVHDIDLARQTLFISQTKFYKSRHVPFGPKVGRCFEEFLTLLAHPHLISRLD